MGHDIWTYYELLSDLFSRNEIVNGEKYRQQLGQLGLVRTEAFGRVNDDNLRKLFINNSEFVEVWCLKQFVVLHAEEWKWTVVWQVVLDCKQKLVATGDARALGVWNEEKMKLKPVIQSLKKQEVGSSFVTVTTEEDRVLVLDTLKSMMLRSIEYRRQDDESSVDVKDYLMEEFTEEIAQKIIDILGLRVKNDILKIQNDQIDRLDLLDVHKLILKRIRDKLKRENENEKISEWLSRSVTDTGSAEPTEAFSNETSKQLCILLSQLQNLGMMI